MNIKKHLADSDSEITYRVLGTEPKISLIVFDNSGEEIDSEIFESEAELSSYLDDKYPSAIPE